DGAVIGGSFKDELLEIFRNEQVVRQRRLDGLWDLGPLFTQSLNVEFALRRVAEIPAMQYGKPVKPLFEDIPQLTLIFRLKLAVFGVVRAPFLRLHFCSGEYQQVTVVKRV